MTRGLKRTSVWRLYIRELYNKGWENWESVGITKSRPKAQNMGKKLKLRSNREMQYKVVKASAKGYSYPYETGYFRLK